MAAALSPSRIRLIGQFTVEAAGEPISDADLGNRKARLLLKLLAASRGEHVSMDSIIEVLWGDGEPAKAIENVASLVSRLRTALGPSLIEGGRAGYRLVIPPDCSIDVIDAERLVTQAEDRLDSGQPALAVTAAAQALEVLGAGVPLEEESVGGEWQERLRRHLSELLRRARVAGWRANTGVGEHRTALAIAQAAIAADPLDEEAHRAVIAAYQCLGESGEALAAYERVRDVLADDLGASPGPETEALYLAVLRAEPIPANSAPQRREVARDHLVGRDDEFARMLHSWEEATRGTASCVLVAGEPGIGKTRLVEALGIEVASTGAATAQARCYESEKSLFLQPLVEALRELGATLAPALVQDAADDCAGPLVNLVPEFGRMLGDTDYVAGSPEMERRRTFEAVAQFLAAVSKRRPTLLVLDDVHNAGASTIELMHFVLRWDRSARLMLVATVQADRLAEVEVVLGERAESIRLGPLSDDAIAQLAEKAGHPELTSDLARLTKGHTLYVVAALHAVAEGDGDVRVPESLRSAVLSRVARCEPAVEEFLRGAVIAGASFELEHVAELLGLTGEDAARRAELAQKSGLLAEAGAGYEFGNDVIRSVLYETTPAPIRTLRHRRLAVLLDAQPEAAAEHAAAAGEWEAAIDHWLSAAHRSLAAFANQEAEGLLTRAMEACTLVGDPSRTARVQLLRGRARINQSCYASATEDLTSAQALARAIGDQQLEAACLEDLGWCAYYARQIDRAAELAERAARHPAAGIGSQVLAGRLRNARGDLPGAVETLQAVVDGPADPEVRASALSYLGSALAHSDRFAEAAEVLAEGFAGCKLAGLVRPMFNAMFFSAMARANLGDLGGALQEATRMSEAVERYHQDAYRPRALNLMAWLSRELGDTERAIDLAAEALEATTLPDGYVEAEPAAHSRLQLAESALLLGDDAQATNWLAEISDTVLASVAFSWRIELRRLELAARSDEFHAEELLGQATRFGSTKYRALALARLGRNQEAVDLAASTGSDLLMAHIADGAQAEDAARRVASDLDGEDRARFLERGAWRVSAGPRRR